MLSTSNSGVRQSQLGSPPASPGARQDWFMMTGDLIINLASEKAGEPRIKPARLSTGNRSLQSNSTPQEQEDRSPSTAAAPNTVPSEQQTPLRSSTHNRQQQLQSEHQHLQQSQQQQQPEQQNPPAAVDLSTKNSTLTRSAASNASSGVADLDDDEPMSLSASSSPEPPNNNNINNNHNSNRHHNNNNITNNNRSINKKMHRRINNNDIDEDEDEDFYCVDDHHHEQPAYENVRELKKRIAQTESRMAMLNNTDDNCDDVMSQSFDFIDSPRARQPETEYDRIARDMYHLNGYHKSDISKNLSKNNDYSRRIAAAYLRHFDFTAMKLDEALREFFSRFFLNGETYEQERVLIYFSKRYHECNADSNFASTDAIHTLVCALMLLNTDLHEDVSHTALSSFSILILSASLPQVILRKMTCSDFIANLAGLNEGGNYSPELLKYLYYSVKNRPLGWSE